MIKSVIGSAMIAFSIKVEVATVKLLPCQKKGERYVPQISEPIKSATSSDSQRASDWGLKRAFIGSSAPRAPVARAW